MTERQDRGALHTLSEQAWCPIWKGHPNLCSSWFVRNLTSYVQPPWVGSAWHTGKVWTSPQLVIRYWPEQHTYTIYIPTLYKLVQPTSQMYPGWKSIKGYIHVHCISWGIPDFGCAVYPFTPRCITRVGSLKRMLTFYDTVNIVQEERLYLYLVILHTRYVQYYSIIWQYSLSFCIPYQRLTIAL